MVVALAMAVRMEEAFLDVFLEGHVSWLWVGKWFGMRWETDSRAALPKTVEMPNSLRLGW